MFWQILRLNVKLERCIIKSACILGGWPEKFQGPKNGMDLAVESIRYWQMTKFIENFECLYQSSKIIFSEPDMRTSETSLCVDFIYVSNLWVKL